jgi:hypothetical protein
MTAGGQQVTSGMEDAPALGHSMIHAVKAPGPLSPKRP